MGTHSKANTAAERKCGSDLLGDGIRKGVSNLAALLLGRYASACMGLTLVRRGEFDWLAVVKVYNSDEGIDMVAFGDGPDVLSALARLNASVGKGKYHEDKFPKKVEVDWKVVSLLPAPASGGLEKQMDFLPDP